MNNDVEIKIKAEDDTSGPVKSATQSIKGMEAALDEAAKAGSRFDTVIGKGGADLRRYGSDLDGVGEGFNDVEDRAMGVGNILTGVNDIMTSDDPATYAMGLSDLAAGIRYAVVPSLQDGAKAVKGMVTQMGGMKGLLVGGGILAGVGALAFGLKSLQDNRTEKKLEDINKQLEETGRLSDSTAEKMLFAAFESDNLDKMLQQVADVGGLKAAQRLVEQAELLGANEESMRSLNSELSELQESYASSAESIASFNEALARQQEQQLALTDPMYASILASQDLADANQAVADATNALNEAEAAGDPVAIAEARRALERAHIDVGKAAQDTAFAEQDLFNKLATGQTTVGAMTASIDALEAQGYLTAGSAAYLRDQINSIQSKHVTIGMSGYESVKWQLDSLYSTLSALPESKTITLGYSSYGIAELNRFRAAAGFAHGGITGAATGGARGGMTWVGERGPELVRLPYGSTVTPHESSKAMAAGMSGGRVPVINLNVQGSILTNRDIVKIIRDEVERGGFRGVFR